MAATQYPHLDTIARIAAAHELAPADPLRQPLAEARLRAAAYQNLWNYPLPDVTDVIEIQAPGEEGHPGVPLSVILPRTAQEQDLPVLVYAHGGGFVLNSADTHARLMRLLALGSGAAVVAVRYSLAPEQRFPRQLHETLAAVAWARGPQARVLGLDGDRLAIGGDSAGANLALAATLVLRDRGAPLPLLGVLLYGMFSARLNTESHGRYGTGAFGLTTERVDWFWRQYLADGAQRDNPLAAPLHADLAGLPPQLVIAAGLDCLRDDSRHLAAKIAAAGGRVTLSTYDDVPHSFMQMSGVLAPADQAVSEATDALRRAMARRQILAAE